MIEPYWTSKDGMHVVYCGDCRDVLQNVGKIDVTITDPPYANGTNYLSVSDDKETIGFLVKETIQIIIYISDRVAITCGVPNMWMYPQPSWVLNWTTPSGSGSCQWGFASWQPILVYGDDPYLKDSKGRRSDTIIKQFLRDEILDHPCPKPVGFMSWLLNRTSRENEIILDPFMGSGTTGVACVRLNRRFIGIEISKEYCDIAVERIKRELSQPRLELEPQPSFEQTKLFDEVE